MARRLISPDGKWIAYAGYDERFQGHQTTNLYVMGRDGSDPHVVTTKLDRDVVTTKWATDGSGIYIQYDDRGDTKFAIAKLDGTVTVIAATSGRWFQREQRRIFCGRCLAALTRYRGR